MDGKKGQGQRAILPAWPKKAGRDNIFTPRAQTNPAHQAWQPDNPALQVSWVNLPILLY